MTYRYQQLSAAGTVLVDERRAHDHRPVRACVQCGKDHHSTTKQWCSYNCASNWRMNQLFNWIARLN